MKIPLLDLRAQYTTIKKEIRQAMDEVLESQYFILGPKVTEMEEKIAAYSNTKYAVGVSSGTDALLISLMAINLEPDDEVITTPFTFFSTAGSIARLNARPVFVDIDPITYNIDPKKIEAALTLKTKAIIPVHLFGQCADMDPIMEIAREHSFYVIEDAAQSIGAEYHGKKAGSLGHIGIFSFFPSKNLGGYGDGGMVVTNDEELNEKLRKLRGHGSKPKYFHKIIGGNFRLDALQASVLITKLKYLDEWSEKRRENADYYDQKLGDSEQKENGSLKPPIPIYKSNGDKNYHIYNQYTIRTQKSTQRDRLRSYLKENDIGTEIYYPLPLHLQECFHYLGYKEGILPVSEQTAKSVLSIPIYPELTKVQQDYVLNKINQFYSKYKNH